MSAPDRARVRDLAVFLKGKKPSVVFDAPVHGAMPYVLIENFSGKYTSYTNDQGCVRCERSDTIVVADGANTGLTTTNHEGYIGSTLGALRPNRAKIDPGYLFFFVQSNFTRLNTRTRGAAVPHLEKELLLDLELALPPLPEQQRIVRILDEAEALRRLRVQADQRTEAVVPALFDELFGDPARNPKHWPEVPVARFVRRFQAGRSVAPAGEASAASKHRILKVSAVTWGRFAAEESKPVPDSYGPTPEQFVRPGDMLFSRANTTELVGATVLVEETPDNLLLPDKLWRFVWESPDEIEPRFVLSLFQHPSIRGELGNRATGTGGSMKNISMEKVMAMDVPLPPLQLQRTFAGRVAEIRALEAAQAASRNRLDDLFQSLLHGAFQGEL